MTVSRLSLRHPGGTTPVLAGEGALETFVQEIGAWVAGRTVFIVTTPRVWGLHGEVLAAALSSAADGIRFEVPEGEAAKSTATTERLWDEMLAAGGKRDSRVIAFGGGSVGDLAGFAAGCFLRGISFLQVPTTLLAQVDASIGGKTGINLPAAKNSVGLFHHPWATIADTRFLATLPRQELAAGLLEVVKAGVVLDAELFEDVESGLDDLLRGDAACLGPIVAHAAQAKIEVVEKDPNEHDLRRLLNFGHTLGHALEARLSYEALRHGEAVGYGMLFALRLAARRGLERGAIERIGDLIRRFELPPLPPSLAPGELLELMRRDKKARESGLVWVLPTRMGSGQTTSEVGEKEVLQHLDSFLAAPLSNP